MSQLYHGGWHTIHNNLPRAAPVSRQQPRPDRPLSAAQLLSDTWGENISAGKYKKIRSDIMSWIFPCSDILWNLCVNCCVNSNIRQRRLKLTRPLWIELSCNPFPYRPELARIGRNVRTLGKDHSSSVVRIPTHTLVSYFPRVVSYGSQSHALLSSSRSICNEDTSPLPAVPYSVISAFKLN